MGNEKVWRGLTVLALALALIAFVVGSMACGLLAQPVSQGGVTTFALVTYRVTDGSSAIAYGSERYTVTNGLVSIPYTATWTADLIAAGILERVGSDAAVVYYGDNAVRVSSTGVVDVQSGAVVSISAPISTPLTLSSTLTVAGNITGASAAIGGGYGSTGCSVSSAGVLQCNGAATTDGLLTAGSGSFGGGFGSSGCSVSAAGVLQCDGAATMGSTLNVTGAVDFEASVLFEGAGDFRTQISNDGGNHSGALYVADNAEVTGTLTMDGLFYPLFANHTVTNGQTLTPAAQVYALDSAGACTITLAASGTEGQFLTLINDDAFTTTIADTNIRATGGGVITMTQYNVLVFVYQDSEWVLVSNSGDNQ